MSPSVRAAVAASLSIALVAPAGAGAAELEGAATPEVPEVPLYVEEAGTGVEHVYAGSWQFFTGGGVAVLDCDDDGLLDLYFAGGSEPAGLYRNESAPGGTLSFSQVGSEATDLPLVTGAYPIDIDNDGVTDLAVLRRGENVLLRGLGGCHFARANEIWGFDGDDDWSTAFSAKWETGDSFPTLAVGDYLEIVDPPVFPDCDASALFRPSGADGFAAPEVLAPGYCSLSMLFTDWDRSGRRDLRVTNDRQYYDPESGEDQLWRVRPDEAPVLYTRGDGWQGLNVFGMSIASQDISGDGYPDYFISSMADNKLRTLTDGPARPAFGDSAYRRGVNVSRPFTGEDYRPSTAWHAEWDDVNNDGRFDLYVAKGNVEKMPDHAAADPSNLLIGQPDGTWAEGAIEAGIVHFDKTRGAALADLNLDGLLDLVEVSRAEPARIWRNAGAGTPTEPQSMGNWLAVELAQDGPNTDAIGSWIEVRSDTGEAIREVTIGGGHVSGALGPVHFGLGEADTAEVRVTWPDGEVGEWMEVAADQRLRIERGVPQPTALGSATVLTGAVGLVRAGEEGPVLPPLEPIDPASCVRTADTDHTVARLWDEALLDAVRRDFPAPTVHARNLYHTSAAMWDAWAAYDPTADGVYWTEKASADDVAAARDTAVSYAAYGLLSHRYRDSAGGPASLRAFDELMSALCYPWAAPESDPAAGLGVAIAEHVIEATMDDGSLEAEGYTSSDYVAVNEPMVVQQPGTHMADPDRWQPLALEISYTQNGQLLPIGPQEFIGPHWGEVSAFALPEPIVPGLPIDPGPPPHLADPATADEFKAKALEVVRYSSLLDPRDGVTVDISPATWGNAPLGSNERAGHEFNPWTSLPYAESLVPRADFGRVLAEFWADGPDSETPPGHWNTLANTVVDHPEFERRIGGRGPELDPLEWDVKMYLALNGAVHDAAVAAWGAKGHYDYVRPISMIRHMGGLGQSSDPDLPAYHPQGLPLAPGEVELITPESSAPGERHAHLDDFVGEVAVRAWWGNPGDTGTELGGVDWIRAVEWVPYQLSTFVTPSFAAYVSGHSTFSRAAAEVLTAMTGSEYFPGGLGTWTVPAGSLEFELGPSVDVPLQWATYYDAADQAGLSRLYGGIHVEADDLRGRVMGAQCGVDAYATAQRYWEGSARG